MRDHHLQQRNRGDRGRIASIHHDFSAQVRANRQYAFVAVPSAAEVLKAQLTQAWAGAPWILDDLSDDEYLWEPVERAWSVRPRGAGVVGWGTGQLVCEERWPAPDPVPMTTIAWRVVHLAAWTDVYSDWTFTEARSAIQDFEVPAGSREGIAWLWRAQNRFSDHVMQLDEASVFELRPAHWGEQLPVINLVTSMLTEHVHHIAEIGVLRDLRRGHARRQPLPPSPPTPEWWAPRS